MGSAELMIGQLHSMEWNAEAVAPSAAGARTRRSTPSPPVAVAGKNGDGRIARIGRYFLVGDLDSGKRDKKEKGDALALRRCPAHPRYVSATIYCRMLMLVLPRLR